VSLHERERLSAYLDGELTTGERALVDAHLAVCAECAAVLADLAAADRAAAALPAEAPDRYFDRFPARVLERIGARKTEARARRLPVWTWAAAAALLLAAVTPLTIRRLPRAPAQRPVATTPAVPLAHESAAPVPEPVLAASASPPAQARPTAGRLGESPSRPASGPSARPSAVPLARSELASDEARAEGMFAREVAAEAPAPPSGAAVATMADVDAVVLQTPGAAKATAAPETRGKGALGGVRPQVAEATVGAGRRQEEARVVVGDAVDPERAFRRLDATRPGSADEWRRLRDDWAAFVAAHPDEPRADEARVRAIEAGREAWLSGGDPDDEAAWRSGARAYLERADARQVERVRGLLSPRR
jgi:hypothetical protein